MADLRVKRGKAKPRTNLHTRVAVPADRIAATGRSGADGSTAAIEGSVEMPCTRSDS